MRFEETLPPDWSNVIWMVILQLNVTFQNIVYYYFIYLYAQEGPQSLFISGLVILLFTRLIWSVGIAWEYITEWEYDSIIERIGLILNGISLGEFFGAVFIINWKWFTHEHISFKWIFMYIAHIGLVSLPMAIIHTLYSIIHQKVVTVAILSVIFNLFATMIIASYFSRTINWKITTYNIMAFAVDFVSVILKIYFLTSFIYYGLYNDDKSIWQNKYIYTLSWIYFIKVFIIGPIYAIWIFVYKCLDGPPNWDWFSFHNDALQFCNNFCITPCIHLMLFILMVSGIWILSECIVCCAPFFLFWYFNDQFWGKDEEKNQWRYVMKYMGNAINSKDYKVRLFLLNYLFWSTNSGNVSNELKDAKVLDKIQHAMNWYISGDRKESKFNQLFDIKIFRHKSSDSDGMIETIFCEC